MGSRVREMTLLHMGAPVDPARDYVVAGWASVNPDTEGPPVWEVVEAYLKHHGTVRAAPRETVRIVGS